MSNLLASLAFIKANVDSGISIWDSLTRLMLNTIKNCELEEVSAESFCKAFVFDYGISIPLHPMNTIIGKIKNEGYIDDTYGKWQIEKSKINSITLETDAAARFDSVILRLQLFSHDRFGLDKTNDEAEKMFIGFINNYDNDLLFCLETKAALPQVEITNAEKYIVSAFVETLVEEESGLLGVVEDIILANIHLNSIFIVEKNRALKLNRAFVYLDTRIVLRLTGIEGEFRKEEYLNLIQILYDNKCNLRIFDVHYNEIVGILDDCIKWLESGKKTPPKYASRALRYYVDHNCTVSDVLLSKAKLDDIIKKYRIGIDTHNYDYDELNQYNIDEKEMHKRISDFYKEGPNHYESQNVDEMIWNDVKAISSIYRKRKGFRANSLENITAIFITSNRTLSKSVREYNRSRRVEEKYSECITDTYWGTAIWLNTAYKETSFYRKKLIADSIALTQMNPKLKEKYFENLKRLKEKGDLSETEYYVLREYSRAADYIKDAAYNDDEEYKDSLPEEILEQFADEIRKPLENIIADKGACLDTRDSQLTLHQSRYEKQIAVIDREAKNSSRIAMTFFGIIVNIPSAVLILVDYFPNNKIKLAFSIVSLCIGLLLCLDGFERKMFGKKIYARRKRNLTNKWMTLK